MELAVATSFWVDSMSYPAMCGIVKWCHSAAALVAAPFLRGRAQLAIFTNNERFVYSECDVPFPRVIPFDVSLITAIHMWSNSTNRTRPGAQRRGMPGRPFSARVRAASALPATSAGEHGSESRKLPPCYRLSSSGKCFDTRNILPFS